MNSRRIWMLSGALALLGLWYVSSFTEWLRPEPIQIVPQFRPLPKELMARRAERANSDRQRTRAPRGEGERPEGSMSDAPNATSARRPDPAREMTRERMVVEAGKPPATNRPVGGRRGFTGREIRDIQPFVFSLDGKYSLTSIKVVENNNTNAHPPIAWWVRSKAGSPPTDQILYGRAPANLEPLSAGSRADKLRAGRTYTLYLEAGRRRGERTFSVPQDAEPMGAAGAAPDDGDYHPEKDVR